MSEEEIWKPIPGYVGYELSTLGRVKSFRGRSEVILKTPEAKRKYYRSNFRQNGITKMEYIHILVARTFIGKRPDGMDVDHKDKNTKNNRADNIRYLDIKTNRGHLGDENPKRKNKLCKD